MSGPGVETKKGKNNMDGQRHRNEAEWRPGNEAGDSLGMRLETAWE